MNARHYGAPLALTSTVLALGVGCSLLPGGAPPAGFDFRFAKHYLAKTMQFPSNMTTLEVRFVRRPLRDAVLNRTIWADADESAAGLDHKADLEKNGFRVGRLSGPLSGRPLAKLLGQEQTDQLVQAPLGESSQVEVSDVYPTCSLLIADGEAIRGGERAKVQCSLRVQTEADPDGRLRLSVTPEVHYGDAEPRYTASEDHSQFILQHERPKEVYQHLAWSEVLAPQDTLILTCRPDRNSSLGHYFFTRSHGDQMEQQLLLIRVAPSGHSCSLMAELPIPRSPTGSAPRKSLAAEASGGRG